MACGPVHGWRRLLPWPLRDFGVREGERWGSADQDIQPGLWGKLPRQYVGRPLKPHSPHPRSFLGPRLATVFTFTLILTLMRVTMLASR